MTDIDLSFFEDPEPFAHDGVTRRLYVSKTDGLPVLMLHELPGMTPNFLHYARQMSADGFKVYAPLLFNEPGDKMGGLQSLRFCMRKQFKELFSVAKDGTGAHPFTTWMLALLGTMTHRHPDQKIGAIGMCLTGGFALAAFAEPNVASVISCQPAYPFKGGVKTLGMTQEQIAETTAGAQALPAPCAKGYKFLFDTAAPTGAHMRAAKTMFGDHFERAPNLGPIGHSTITGFTPGSEKYDTLYADMRAFLADRLT